MHARIRPRVVSSHVNLTPGSGSRVGGTIHKYQLQSRSEPGLGTPFFTPGAPNAAQTAPTGCTDTFQEWVDYYLNRIGSAVEVANAHAYNWMVSGGSLNSALATVLSDLADDLNLVSHENFTWPLDGVYEFNPNPKSLNVETRVLEGTFRIKATFERDPDFDMTVNATLEVTGHQTLSPPASMSSSSYIMTSSSSSST